MGKGPATAACLIFAFVLFAYAPALAQSEEVEPLDGEECVFNVQLENDLFGSGADNHYTQGLRFSYVFPVKTDSRKRKCIPFEDEFRTVANTASAPIRDFLTTRNNRISLLFGQNIFTPDDITRTDLIADDRPYAGWLYVGAGWVSERGTNGGGYMDNLEINVGVVGPLSLAEQTQTWWHEVIDTREPRGWDHQLKNEPGLLISYERKWPIDLREGLGYKLELTPSLGGAVGNVYTYASVGGMLRYGYKVPEDYGPPTIRPGLQGSGFFQRRKEWGWYLFAGVEGRAVARNIFLDGNTFRDSHSVDKKPLVADLQVGLVMTYDRYRFGFTNIFRTKEFDGQKRIDEFGSINFSVLF